MFRQDYKQDVTYWEPLAQDGWGSKTFETPIILKCRWENRAERFIDALGEEVVSRAVVWLPQNVEIKGYLFLGSETSVDPTIVLNAYEVRQIFEIPDLRNMFKERRVFL